MIGGVKVTVVIISKIQWSVITVRNVTSITLSNGNYTIVGDTSITVSAENNYVRIMEG